MSILIVADRDGDEEVRSLGLDLRRLLSSRNDELFCAVAFGERGFELVFLKDETTAAQVLHQTIRDGHASGGFRAPVSVLNILAQLTAGLH